MSDRRTRAAFLDRDGTIIADKEYMCDPDQVELLPGSAEGLRLLAMRGVPAIVCTNQSGIARGLITPMQYLAVHRRMVELLAAEGVTLLDTFSCPHHPEISGPCDCRKPATGMFERAALLHDLDLHRCLFIGDKDRDVDPARFYGARGMLISAPASAESPPRTDATVITAASLADGVPALLASHA